MFVVVMSAMTSLQRVTQRDRYCQQCIGSCTAAAAAARVINRNSRLKCCFSVDSITLVEEGFEVVSTDASDKMLKFALKERWARRKEPHFDSWGT